MRVWKGLLILFAAMILVLAACGSDDNGEADSTADKDDSAGEMIVYKPEAINPDVDVCEVCAMAVADDQFATQIVLKNKRALKFDDIGCMYRWINENGEDDIGAKFVRDYHTEEWMAVEEAVFVYDEQIETPMAYGMISFKDVADAEAFIEENGYGKLLTAADLMVHEWKMMMHDHHGHDDMGDHDDHGEHDDHDDHGEHDENHDEHDDEE